MNERRKKTNIENGSKHKQIKRKRVVVILQKYIIKIVVQ